MWNGQAFSVRVTLSGVTGATAERGERSKIHVSRRYLCGLLNG